MQYVTGGIVSPLRAEYASERQDSASKKMKSGQSSLKRAVIVHFEQIAALGALLWLVAQRFLRENLGNSSLSTR
jgi:hypothetical protein